MTLQTKLLLAFIFFQLCKGAKRNLRGTSLLREPCLLVFKVERLLGNQESFSVVCELLGEDAKNHGPQRLFIAMATQAWVDEKDVVSGETTFYTSGAMIDGDHLSLPDGAADSISLETIQGNSDRRRLATSTGDKNVLAVRVIAKDSRTTYNEGTIRNKIFGTNGDKVTVASQYRACSGDQLRLHPTRAAGTNNGVTTVTIDTSVKDKTQENVEALVVKELTAKLGNLQWQFHNVMLCLPKETNNGGWVAYGYVNHWLSVYNDNWCGSVSAQMHEMGHNMNLAHSGQIQDSEYADQSGMMGFSYQQDNAPLMCFNGPKSWQLGWYSDHGHDEVRPLVQRWNGFLVGVSEYTNGITRPTLSGFAVILKIVGDAKDDYYVAFNRKSGYNSGTVEGGDMVLVTKRKRGRGYSQSTLIAMLREGQTHSVSNFQGKRLNIKFNNISKEMSLWKALVEVYTS